MPGPRILLTRSTNRGQVRNLRIVQDRSSYSCLGRRAICCIGLAGLDAFASKASIQKDSPPLEGWGSLRYVDPRVGQLSGAWIGRPRRNAARLRDTRAGMADIGTVFLRVKRSAGGCTPIRPAPPENRTPLWDSRLPEGRASFGVKE